MNGLHISPVHPGDGHWRAYLDGQVYPVRRDQLTAHLSRCSRCQATLRAIEAEARFAGAKLRALQIAVGEAEALPPW